MFLFERVSENKIHISIDLTIFNERVISKTLYWLTEKYFIYWQVGSGNIQEITLEKKNGNVNNEEFRSLHDKMNQDFIDYKNRDIILNETKNVRDILYIKAFANNDEFEDYNLMD